MVEPARWSAYRGNGSSSKTVGPESALSEWIQHSGANDFFNKWLSSTASALQGAVAKKQQGNDDLDDDDASLDVVAAGGSLVDILRGHLDDSRFGVALHKVFQAPAVV